MKFQHETSLIQPGLVSPSLSPSALLAGNQSIINDQFTAVANFNPIEYCTWSTANSSKLCVYLSGQNQVQVFDSKNYDKKEKFALKAVDKKYSRSSFTVKGFEFSPDGTRLAIGQTDCIIYIYKLGISSDISQQQQLSNSNSMANMATGQFINGQLSSASNQMSITSSGGASLVLPSKPTIVNSTQSNKPTITGKFATSSPITCLLWNEAGIIFGSQDGKVKLISTASPSSNDTASNKVITIMVQQSPAVALVSSKNNSNVVVAGFINGSVILANQSSTAQLYGKTNRQSGQAGSPIGSIQAKNLVDHSCVPFALCLTNSNHICIGGSDGKLYIGQIYEDAIQREQLSIKSKQVIDIRSEIHKIDCSPSSDVLVVASGERIMIVKLDSSQLWRTCYSVILKNSIMISSLVWSPDGSQLIAGTLNGALELFSCRWNHRNINDKFEISYIGKNQITIKNLQTSQLCAVIKSKFDITNIRLIQSGQYAIVWTSHTLILVRLADTTSSISSKLSEIDWSGMSTQNVRFCFDYMNVVAISLAGEIMIVELGINKIFYSVRSDYPSRHLISIKGFDSANNLRENSSDESNMRSLKSSSKLFCYMIDAKTLCVVDLQNQLQLLTWTNDKAIDWLELSDSGLGLLFRDRSLQLYHLKIDRNNRGTNQLAGVIDRQRLQQLECVNLVNSCGFAQWVHDTDVIVAQSSTRIYVWYDLQKPIIYDARSTLMVSDNGATSEAPIVSASETKINNCPDIVSIERGQVSPSSNSTTRIVLSNETSIVLDMAFIEFDTTLRDGDLLAALSFLEYRQINSTRAEADATKKNRHLMESAPGFQGDNRQNLSSLWYSLADKAMTLNEIGVAERALAELGEYSKCRYLRSCRQDSINCEWKLALFRNDWASFETLAEIDVVIREYKRLNRWTAAIAYLERIGQYRHKDNLEHEYHEWLLSKGQVVEVARLMAQSGQLIEALKLLLTNKRLKFASRLLLEHYGGSNSGGGKVSSSSLFLSSSSFTGNDRIEDIMTQLKDNLVEQHLYEEAAQLCESKTLLNDQIEALNLFIKAKCYSKAIAIARSYYPEKVVDLEEEYGDYIMDGDTSSSKLISVQDRSEQTQQAQPKSAAIDHYIEAGKLEKALKAAMELRQYDKAAQIVPSMNIDNESIVNFCKNIGDHYRLIGRFEEAVTFYKLGRHNQSAVDTYLERSEFTKAYQVAMDLLGDKDKVNKMFMSVALELLQSQGQPNCIDAEKIYLMLGEVDLAIDMYKRFKQYDQMVRLIHDYHPDLLENSLILLGGELESQGNLEQAERYYLMASDSEWKNVVRMYRNANRWPDAFRVCVSHEPATQEQATSQSVKVQIAYWWSKSLSSMEESVKLLVRIGHMIKPVLNYAIECKNFDYALDLIKSKEFKLIEGDDISYQFGNTIRIKYASWLEQQGKFEQAEKFFVDAGQIPEAVDMYMENAMFTEALRLAEQHPKLQYQASDTENSRRPLEEKVLISYANHILKTAPINQTSDTGYRKAVDDSLSQAQQLYLRANRPDLAIEIYTSRSMWREALQVARKFAPNLLATIEQNLDYNESDAVTPLNRNYFDRILNSSDLNNSLSEPRGSFSSSTTNGLNHNHILTSNQSSTASSSELANYNYHPSMAIVNTPESDVDIVQSDTQNQESQGTSIIDQISAAIERNERRHVKRLVCKYVTNLINSNEIQKAVYFAYEIGNRCPYIYSQQEVISLIMRLSSDILRNYQWGILEEQQHSNLDSAVLELWCTLRDTMLQIKLSSELEENSTDKYFNNLMESLNKHLMAAHYISLHCSLIEVFYEQQHFNRDRLGDDASFGIQQSALGLLTSISTSLLRYTDIISVDRAFYVAGFWCKAAQKLDMAYIFWNHLLDLLEAIESKSTTVDDEAFKGTDIPTDIKLPQRQFSLAFNVRAQVQDWVLQTLLELSTPPSLPHDSRGVYEASLQKRISASNTKTVLSYPSCLISGYPVLDLKESIQFRQDYAARHKDWNSFISLIRRSTNSGKQTLPRVLDFIAQLTGTNRESLDEYKFAQD